MICKEYALQRHPEIWSAIQVYLHVSSSSPPFIWYVNVFPDIAKDLDREFQKRYGRKFIGDTRRWLKASKSPERKEALTLSASDAEHMERLILPGICIAEGGIVKNLRDGSFESAVDYDLIHEDLHQIFRGTSLFYWLDRFPPKKYSKEFLERDAFMLDITSEVAVSFYSDLIHRELFPESAKKLTLGSGLYRQEYFPFYLELPHWKISKVERRRMRRVNREANRKMIDVFKSRSPANEPVELFEQEARIIAEAGKEMNPKFPVERPLATIDRIVERYDDLIGITLCDGRGMKLETRNFDGTWSLGYLNK